MNSAVAIHVISCYTLHDFYVCGFEHAGGLQPWQERELAMAAIADAVPFQPFGQNRFWIVLSFSTTSVAFTAWLQISIGSTKHLAQFVAFYSIVASFADLEAHCLTANGSRGPKMHMQV